MLGSAPGAKRAEHHCDQEATSAANDERQQNGQDRAASLSLMGTGKSDAIDYQRPDACDQTAANRNHLQWTR